MALRQAQFCRMPGDQFPPVAQMLRELSPPLLWSVFPSFYPKWRLQWSLSSPSRKFISWNESLIEVDHLGCRAEMLEQRNVGTAKIATLA